MPTMPTHPKTAGRSATTNAPAEPVEFSHLEQVSPRDDQTPTTPPTTTPFLV